MTEGKGKTAAGMSLTESQLVIGMHRLVQDLDRQTAAVAREHGLTTTQFAVLEALLRKGPLTVGELRESVLSSDGTIPVVIRHLRERGLVVRGRDPADGRRAIVSLTPAGEGLARAVCPTNYQALHERLAAWGPDDQRAMARLIRAYRDANR